MTPEEEKAESFAAGAIEQQKRCEKHARDAYDRGWNDAVEKAAKCAFPESIGYKGRLSDVITALECARDDIRALKPEGEDGK